MKSRLILMALAAALIASMAASLASAQPVTVFSDDFGPQPLGGWTASPLGLATNWDASSGAAAYNGGGHTQLYAGSAAWTDYRYEVKFKVDAAQDYPGGIRGRVDLNTGAGYAAWVYPGQGLIKLWRSTAWHIDTTGLTLLSQESATITPGVFHTLALTFSGSQISVEYDGTTLITATDSTLTAGAVALDVSNQPITYDDVAVTSGTTTLLADDFGPKPLHNWTSSPLGLATNWDASSGVAAYNGGGHTQLYAGSSTWADYTVQTKFRLANGNNFPGGLRGRVNTSTGASYAAWIYPADGVIKLFRVVAWNIDTTGLTLLTQANVGTISTGVFHTLSLTFQGSSITVGYDGTNVIQTTDSAYSAGAVALDVSNQPIDFDDVQVTADPVPANALFGDDFRTGTLANWTASPLGLLSNWDASSFAAHYNGGGHTQIYAGSSTWTDYKVEAKVRLANGSDYPGGIRGRVNTSTGESYAAWIYPAEGVIKLYRAAAWHIDTAGLALLAQANVGTITPNVFHTLSITFQGSSITVTWDGSAAIQTTDTVLTAGAIALDVSNQPIDFDDVFVTPVAAAPPPALFSDDFSGGLAGWTASPLGLFSNWSGAAGTASYNGGGHTQIYAGNTAWTAYKVEAKVRLANGSNFPGGIRGRVNTSTGESYAAWLYPADGVIKLFRAAAWNIDTPGFAILAQANVGTIAPSVWHTLSLSFSGSQISVGFNGTTVIQVTDTVLAAGAIALDVSNQPIDFDDVIVTQLGGSTTPPPDNDNGPGGPILVISKSTNPFTRYAGEILLAEGLNQYAIQEIGTLDAATLANYDVAILGDTSLTSAQVTMLSDWVNAGGNLIAFRPDPQLAGLLGLTSASSALANAYLKIDTTAAPGQGLVDQTIQYHGTADLYTLNGATAIATLYSDASTVTSNPAVTLRSVGSAGGQAAAFTYDLARSVVYTRQGNPAWAGQERDGVTPKRSDDLFFGAATGDPQTDWIDLNKVAIPQADEQQRLLANLILAMNADRKPLPRFWYLPRGLKAAVVMTGDDHGNNGTQGRFEVYETASPTGCNVDNWECVRATSYIYPSTPLPPSAALAFQSEGFEIGVHVSSNCEDWTPSGLESFFATQLADFASLFSGINAPVTNRTHCIAWSDWATEPKTEKAHGIRFDTNYYYWPGSWIQDRPGLFTGSGMPMRFADTDGTRIDVYQATTQMTDESGQTFPFTIDTLLDNALGASGYYAVLTANMHTDTASHAGSDAILASAQERGVPIVSAQQMLTWIDGRNGSKFSGHTWSGGVLSFTITAATGANGLQALLPATTPAGTLASLTANGSPVTFTTQTIKGITYAVFSAASGAYVATYAP